MKQKPRIYHTENQKALMWERWRKGDSLQQIAQLFDRNHPSIQRILAESGGIQPEAATLDAGLQVAGQFLNGWLTAQQQGKLVA